MRVKSDRQLHLRFFLLTRWIFQMHWDFYMKRYRNRSIRISVWSYFYDISILFISFSGFMESKLLLWVLSSGLKCARELRASKLKHEDCCFHHLQTFLRKATLSNNLIYVFLSFWLASWGPKLKTFAVNVERQWQKVYWQISAKIVVIRSPSLFF